MSTETTRKIDNISSNTANEVTVNDRLVVNSTTKASRPFPQMSETERDALTPVTGDIIDNTDSGVIERYSGSSWVGIGSGGGGLDKWVTLTEYAADAVIWNETDNKIYRCVTANTDTDFTPSKWKLLSYEKASSVYAEFNAENRSVEGFTNIIINTTTPMSGDADYSVTSFPAELPPVVLDPIRVNAAHGNVTLYTSLTSGTAQVVVYDQDGNNLDTATIEAGTAQRTRLEWFPSTDDEDYTLVFEDVSSATDLYFDDVVFSDSPREVKEFTVTNSIGLSGSDDDIILGTTNIPFNGSGTGWDGTLNEYTIQHSDQILMLKISIEYLSNTTRPFINMYRNGVQHKTIDLLPTSSVSTVNSTSYVGVKGEFSKGDKVSFRGRAGTLNSGTYHYLNITETATKEGTVYSSDDKPTDFEIVADKALSLDTTSGVTGTITEMTVPLIVGEKYSVVFNGEVSSTSTSYTNEITVLNGSSTIGHSLKRDGDQSIYLGSHVVVDQGFIAEGNLTVTVNDSTNSILKATRTKIKVIRLPKSNIDNFIVDVGTKHVTGGEEYPTGDTIDGKPIYARMWIVETDITVTTTIDTIPVGLKILAPYATLTSNHWSYFPVTFSGADYIQFDYNDSTGLFTVVIGGSRDILAGTKLSITYTKP